MTNYDLIQELMKYPMEMEVLVPSKTGNYDFAKIQCIYEAEVTNGKGEEKDYIIIDES